MQVSAHLHALRIPFQIPLAPGKSVDRFVYTFLVNGQKVCLIDSGVSASKDQIYAWIGEVGRVPEDVDLLLLTHAHPDHIGGAAGIQKRTGCKIAAHLDGIQWIEDTERQFRERPVPGFPILVEGPVKIDTFLSHKQRLELDAENHLQIMHTPGHCNGHLALFHEEDGVLISGDCIPMPGEMPIYDDPRSLMASLRGLELVEGVKVLLSSWDEPRPGDQKNAIVSRGMTWLICVHREVMQATRKTGSSDPQVLAPMVIKALELPESSLNPLFFRTIKSHLQIPDWLD